MMRIRILIFGFLASLSIAESTAQDAVFSQFYNSTLYLNPAMAGIEDDFTVSLSHRSQWQTLLFPYTTSQLSVIMPIYRSKHTKPFGHIGGVGLSVYNDTAGQDGNFKTTGVNGAFAYNLPLDKKHVNQITFGLQVGLISKRIDTENLQWGEQYTNYIAFGLDPLPSSEVQNIRNRSFVDFNFGAFYWYYPIQDNDPLIRSVNSGISISHLNNPNESLLEFENNRLPLLYKYHGGIVFNAGSKSTISLNYLSAFQESVFQHNIGVYAGHKLQLLNSEKFQFVDVRLGTWYRIKDSFIILTEFETRMFKLGLSYDLNTSSLRYNDRGIGTYEIHLSTRLTSHAPPKSRY